MNKPDKIAFINDKMGFRYEDPYTGEKEIWDATLSDVLYYAKQRNLTASHITDRWRWRSKWTIKIQNDEVIYLVYKLITKPKAKSKMPLPPTPKQDD